MNKYRIILYKKNVICTLSELNYFFLLFNIKMAQLDQISNCDTWFCLCNANGASSLTTLRKLGGSKQNKIVFETRPRTFHSCSVVNGLFVSHLTKI